MLQATSDGTWDDYIEQRYQAMAMVGNALPLAARGEIRALEAQGHTVEELAARFGISTHKVARIITENESRTEQIIARIEAFRLRDLARLRTETE